MPLPLFPRTLFRASWPLGLHIILCFIVPLFVHRFRLFLVRAHNFTIAAIADVKFRLLTIPFQPVFYQILSEIGRLCGGLNTLSAPIIYQRIELVEHEQVAIVVYEDRFHLQLFHLSRLFLERDFWDIAPRSPS